MPEMTHEAAKEQSALRDKSARIVTEVFNPPWVGIAVLGAVAAHNTQGLGQFLQWWAIAAFFSILLPLGFLVQALLRGRVSDWYVTRAQERMVPFTVAAVSFGAAALIMVLLSAPHQLLAATLAGMVGLFVALALTPKWKLSIHTGSVAGGVVVLGLVFSPWALTLVLVVPLVGWARLRIAHHTTDQVVVGGLIGAAVAAIVFTTVTALA